MSQLEDYQMFVREWKFNHPKLEIPTVAEWKKWFKIKIDYRNKVNSNYDINKKKKTFSQA